MDAHPLKLKVRSYAAETPFIRSLMLGVEDGPVPRWQAGAHVRVALPNGGDRPYSLMALPGLAEDALALGVLREEASTGGSQFMHALKIGDVVTVEGTRAKDGGTHGNARSVFMNRKKLGAGSSEGVTP